MQNERKEGELRKQIDNIKQWYRERANIPDSCNTNNIKKLRSEIEQKVEEEKNKFEKYLAEEDPDKIRNGYINFKRNLSDYRKFRFYFEDDKNNLSFVENIKSSKKLRNSLKNLKDAITKLGLVYSYQKTKEIRGMSQITSEDFDPYYKNRKEQADEESITKQLLSEGSGHQQTTFSEAKEENIESISLIVGLIDKYIAGDNEEEFIKALKSVKERKKIEAGTSASSPAIKKVLGQIEKENELAIKLEREDMIKSEKEIPFYAYLRFMRGNILQKRDNYYRRKHFYITSYLGESLAKDNLWKQEGMDQILVQLILNKWQEKWPTDTDLVLNNYYRSMFASAVFHREDGYKLLDDLRKDLFGRWIKIKQIKQSKMWSFLQTCLDRKKDGEVASEKQIEILQRNPKELRQQVIDKFGYRNWLVYFFRKIKKYGLRPTIEEIHKRKLGISKKTIDPMILRIDDWLKNK